MVAFPSGAFFLWPRVLLLSGMVKGACVCLLQHANMATHAAEHWPHAMWLSHHRCCGHSGNIEHIDWSLPISQPGSKLHGQMIIQATDSSTNLLHWDPRTGG